jgi:type II secretory pathway pseudopilin PulG
MNRPTGRGEGGETLIELLISIMIIGIAVTAILGAVRIATDASTLDQRQIHAQALLRSWGEYAVAQTTDANYVTSCATPLTYPGTLPSGFTATQTKVEFWNGTSSYVAGTCGSDLGVRRLELTMTVASSVYPGFASTYDVVIRRPCAPPLGSPAGIVC